MVIYTVLFEKLYIISRLKEPKRQEISRSKYSNMRFLRSSKCSKTTVKLTFTSQKANALVLGLLILFSTGNTLFG